eukprot:TCONS_00025019-protein
MLKNLRRKAPEKDKLGHDLFKLAKTGEHGSPNKPSAIAYDSQLHLLAIGTQSGHLKVYGKPGVELIAQESSAATTCIQQLFFLEGQGRIISVCDDGEQNTLHLWEINNPYGSKSILEEVKACTLEGRLKKISVCCLSMAKECLYIGTEGGHIYVLDLISFELKDHVIYQDIVMQSLPGNTTDNKKSNGGSVEALQEHPTDPEKLLIGYKKGIIVLWNQSKIKAEGPFVAQPEVESVYWHKSCERFISAHENGSLSVWKVPQHETGNIEQQSSTPFGPFPCKAIRKVEWHNDTVIFSGGLPRASYGDKHSVSILEDNTVKVVLDFTSKVIDFFSIYEEHVLDALVVLCEEEVVVVDLKNSSEKGYQVYDKPYLACIHSSPISATTHVTDIPKDLWAFLVEAGKKQTGNDTSLESWPVDGGRCLLPELMKHDILITGHEDGTVKFWNVTGLSFTLIYTISTSKLFQSDMDDGPPPDDGDDEDWPPFKKVGNFDPFADDPRFVVQKILLCPVTKVLLVGGSGGQLMIYNLQENEKDSTEITDVNVIANLEGFEWKGHGPLSLRTDPVQTQHGILPERVLQLRPSAPITAIAMESAWGLLAVGTCHGLVVFDYLLHKVALVKCTVNPTDLANTGAGIQRKRTLAKSLRDSFRRLRSKRGSKRGKKDGNKADGAASPGGVRSVGYEASPQTRLIDEQRVDEDMLSMVRCIYFGETFLGDGGHRTATMWAGTNAGYIYVYSLIIPPKDERHTTEVKTEVGKELKLKHHAPVVNIFVVDKNGVPVCSVSEQEAGRTQKSDMSGGHSVLISSEEQFKVFTLPTLRPRNKEKLTAVDGSRVRKLGIIDIPSKTPEGADIVHHCLMCLTNQGDVMIYSIPNLKQQMKKNVAKREDIRAISSLLFTHDGEGFYLKSTSELQRFSVLSSNKIVPDTIIKLPHGMRPDEDDRSDDDELTSPTSPTSPVSFNSNITNHKTEKV